MMITLCLLIFFFHCAAESLASAAEVFLPSSHEGRRVHCVNRFFNTKDFSVRRSGMMNILSRMNSSCGAEFFTMLQQFHLSSTPDVPISEPLARRPYHFSSLPAVTACIKTKCVRWNNKSNCFCDYCSRIFSQAMQQPDSMCAA